MASGADGEEDEETAGDDDMARETDDTEDDDDDEDDDDEDDEDLIDDDDETDEVDEDEYEFNETGDDKENFNDLPASKKLEIEMLKRKLVSGNPSTVYHSPQFLPDPNLSYHQIDDQKTQLLNFMLKQQQQQQQKEYEKWLKANMMMKQQQQQSQHLTNQPQIDPIKQQKLSEVERIKQELIGFQRELELMQKKRELAKNTKPQKQEADTIDDNDDEKRFERADSSAHLKHYHHHENPPVEPVNTQIHESAIHSKPVNYKAATNGAESADSHPDDSVDVAEMIEKFRLNESVAAQDKSINVHDKSN